MADSISVVRYLEGVFPTIAQEIVVGAAGGITQVLIGQPFDIVKVRMQINESNKNMLAVARSIWRHEGPLTFYRGSAAPLVGVGACVSLVYSSFNGFHNALESLKVEDNLRTIQQSSLSQIYIEGGIAGLVNSVISGPMEHIRIRLQGQTDGTSLRYYSSTRDCIRKIFQEAGLAGIYRGQTATMVREFSNYGIWFAVYEALIRQVMKSQGKSREELPGWQFACCGGLVGEVLWVAGYPIDVIKSKMQTDGFGEHRRYRNIWDVIRHTKEVDGLCGFYRGLSPTLLRAMPVAAGTFAVIEMVKKAIT